MAWAKMRGGDLEEPGRQPYSWAGFRGFWFASKSIQKNMPVRSGLVFVAYLRF
jgi:hypothetical protein